MEHCTPTHDSLASSVVACSGSSIGVGPSARPILANHLDDLNGSGLTSATILASGVYSETDPVEIARILNWNHKAVGLGPCLVFPYRATDGSFSAYARVKPDLPRLDREKPGKAAKYESPRGTPNHAYFTPGIIDLLRDSQHLPASERAFIIATEGEKKSLAADQAGFPSIGLTGPWGWQKKREKDIKGRKQGPRELLDELAAIDWNTFQIGIIHDTDPRRNPSVHHGFCELARILHDQGAEVEFIQLPLGPRGPAGLPGKVGLDDFIVAHGQQAFADLVHAEL